MITISELQDDQIGRKVFTLSGPGEMAASIMILNTVGGITYDISNVFVVMPNINPECAWKRARAVVDWLNTLSPEEAAHG